MIIQEFLNRVEDVHKTGVATEHSYRSALEFLIGSFEDDIKALNEPKRVKCGAPDFIVQNGEITIGHIEAKDIGVDLTVMKGANLDQKKRYLKALPNLIYTNCLDFEFYRNGERVASVSIADPIMGIQPKPENFERLEHLLRDFISQRPQTITSSKTLAGMMAGKALMIKDVFAKVLVDDSEGASELHNQYTAFQDQLIHDISKEDFADIYAETIAYGMFAARLHDDTLDTFSRLEALELLPKSNPFLRSLFSYIAGPDLDDRIRWIINELADVFQACDVREIMASFGRLTARNDPFLHFYEDFLKEYNPKKRKARGVWYTPEPVVNFIVRAVDDVLKTEFGLPMGLADHSKITVDWDTGQKELTKKGKIAKSGKNATEKREVHRVQILDPATGTGTFLAEVIKHIAPRIKDVGEAMWSPYIEKELIPRLHGFELLMASYAMCHMKLDMVLTELGYKPSGKPPRLSVYLTNSLEEGEPANQTLPFAQWLSNEVKAANTIKRDMPIMCIIGNPPYSGESANKGDWIMGLMDAYKREPGGQQKLQERNPKWINDDYVKFIRFSEHMIEKNGEGVLAFITNHGYLDNPTFRGMRWHLLKTFDKIYVVDLHGNAKKKEVSPDGSADKNVFDIMQGVALIVAVKKTAAPTDKKAPIELASVYHTDLWGSRKAKYDALWAESLQSTDWIQLENRAPAYAFVPKDYDLEEKYETGFSLNSLYLEKGNGVVTKRDKICIHMDEYRLREVLSDFIDSDEKIVRQKYKLPDDVRDWKYGWAREDIKNNYPNLPIEDINYRPFDQRKIFYSGQARGFVGWPVQQIMRHYLNGNNIGLLAPKAMHDKGFAHCFVTNRISEAIFLSGTTGSNAMNFPLYLYPAEDELDQTRRVNFDPKIYKSIQDRAEHPEHGTPDEIAVFDYIYGVLHSPDYRETFEESLKSDFPRIPYPTSPDVFWHVAEKGGGLRRLHLMEADAVGDTPYPLSGDGDLVVDKPTFTETREGMGRVHFNADQYFDSVPKIAWEFYIGGYQPAQKWLKDRKGRTLSFDDVQHYQKIIKILSETDRVMKEIELPL